MISVIVPVYNGEKYLEECILSILNQRYADFELVLLDDGSKDRSGEICDKYACKDSRIRVIHKRNEGINATRRAGVILAKGDWIVFCDDDDTMPEYALSHLWKLHDDTDLVIGFPFTPRKNWGEMTFDECRKEMIIAQRLPPSPWAKLYRKDILSKDVFDFPRDIDGCEDMIMNIRVMAKINRAPRILYEKVYDFRRNKASVSHTKKASLEYEALFDRVRRMSIPEEMIPSVMKEILWSRINGLTSIAYNNPQLIAHGDHPYLQELRSDIKKYNYRCNVREWLITHCKSTMILKLTAFCRLVSLSVNYRIKSW